MQKPVPQREKVPSHRPINGWGKSRWFKDSKQVEGVQPRAGGRERAVFFTEGTCQRKPPAPTAAAPRPAPQAPPCRGRPAPCWACKRLLGSGVFCYGVHRREQSPHRQQQERNRGCSWLGRQRSRNTAEASHFDAASFLNGGSVCVWGGSCFKMLYRGEGRV